MFVVVIVVNRVPASVVNVVDVIAVRDGHMTTSLAVNVVVPLVNHVAAIGFTFVEVIVMRSVKMTIVDVVDVIAVRDRDMPASGAVSMVMADVLMVNRSAHFPCPFHLTSSLMVLGCGDSHRVERAHPGVWVHRISILIHPPA